MLYSDIYPDRVAKRSVAIKHLRCSNYFAQFLYGFFISIEL